LPFDSGMPRPRPPYVQRQENRPGQVRWVFRKGHGPRIYLPGPPGSEGFDAAYMAALASYSMDKPAKVRGSLQWMIDEYRQLHEWQALAPSSRKMRENLFARLVKAVGADADPNSITQRVMQRAVDARSAHASRNMLKAYRPLFRWAARNGYVAANPCEGLELAKATTKGFHTWTVQEVEAFHAHWPTGTRQRLAMDLLLYTGLRRQDLVTLGRQHIRGDLLEVVASKTKRAGVVSYIPLTQPLQEALKHAPTDNLTFLVTARGKPFEAASFGNWFREACVAAGVPGRAHGLRKAGATILAERGASPYALMAIFGWRTLAQAERYTREANRKNMAREAGKAFGS
jgi:integrase